MRRARCNGRGFIERDNRPEPAQGARYNDRATQAFASRSGDRVGPDLSASP
jgi:hypothetical protein